MLIIKRFFQDHVFNKREKEREITLWTYLELICLQINIY